MVLAWSGKPALPNQRQKSGAEPLPVVCLITPQYKRLSPADDTGRRGSGWRRRRREGGGNNQGCKAIKALVNVDWMSLRSAVEAEEHASPCVHGKLRELMWGRCIWDDTRLQVYLRMCENAINQQAAARRGARFNVRIACIIFIRPHIRISSPMIKKNEKTCIFFKFLNKAVKFYPFFFFFFEEKCPKAPT